MEPIQMGPSIYYALPQVISKKTLKHPKWGSQMGRSQMGPSIHYGLPQVVSLKTLAAKELRDFTRSGAEVQNQSATQVRSLPKRPSPVLIRG